MCLNTPFGGYGHPLIGMYLDHFAWVQHWFGAVYRDRCCSRRWRPWEHGHRLPIGLLLRLGCPAVSLRNDNCLSNFR